ncbi:MAG: hydrolase 1, exosortase A system-associated, partial [Sphingomonadaceae bacterium]
MARRPLIVTTPDGLGLAAMAHPADGTTGVLIIPGAPQTRVGAHRGFVGLADALAAASHPALRLDRRGLGDSDGEDPGFAAIGADIAAAQQALRVAFPAVRRVIGVGLCDGATALALAPDGLDALVL